MELQYREVLLYYFHILCSFKDIAIVVLASFSSKILKLLLYYVCNDFVQQHFSK